MESAITQIRTGDRYDANGRVTPEQSRTHVGADDSAESFLRERRARSIENLVHTSDLARKIVRPNVRRVTVCAEGSSTRPSPCPLAVVDRGDAVPSWEPPANTTTMHLSYIGRCDRVRSRPTWGWQR